MSLERINLLSALDFSGAGKMGVYLFFSLSAFLLTWQALNTDNSIPRNQMYWAGYFLRRMLRIYPLYFIALFVSLMMTNLIPGYTPRITSPSDLFEHLLLQKGTSIYWAIPVEFCYYLVLPIVVFALQFARRAHQLGPLSLAVVAVIVSSIAWPSSETPANSVQLGPYLSIFLLGSLIASIVTSELIRDQSKRNHLLSITGFFALIIALMTVPAFWREAIDPTISNRAFHKDFLLYGLLWGVCILAAVKGARYFTALFEWTPIRFMGRISFSIYLWHYPVIQLVARDIALQPWLQFLLVITIALPLSWISYRLIERPFISWGHRKTNHW